MAKFALIDPASKRIEHEFDAVDIAAARTAAVTWCTQKRKRALLVGLIRVITPVQTVSTTIQDDPA